MGFSPALFGSLLLQEKTTKSCIWWHLANGQYHVNLYWLIISEIDRCKKVCLVCVSRTLQGHQLLWPVFLSFNAQKINLKFFWKCFRVCTEKLHRIQVKKSKEKSMEIISYGGKPVFSRAKNLRVNIWRSGPDICSLICDYSTYFWKITSLCIAKNLQRKLTLQYCDPRSSV